MKLRHLLLGGILTFSLAGFANPVLVKMNAVSKTMSLAEKESGTPVALPEPENQIYSLELDPGDYTLSAYGTDGKTLNGTIVINVTDSVTTQQFTVITCTAYVSNKHEDSTPWTIDAGDFDLDVKINTREGVRIEQTPGRSVTANRYTFLALNGNSYNVAFIPTEKHRRDGFMALYRGGTLTANVNVTGAIPTGGDFSITVPSDARLQLGMKFTHFTDFTPVDPYEVEEAKGGTTYRYTLANGQVYNYRTWRPGGLTHGGYFTMNTTDESKCPKISFTAADYEKQDPKAINHSGKSNSGYETGDLLLNINPAHHLRLNVGEDFLVHGMRMWELSDNSTNNYFFEPDFHYTVLDADFHPCSDIIEIDNADTTTSAWSKITAKKEGTAIVMVTYDGINLNYYNNADKKDYLGGEYWGAIWPENTGVFVVSVGQSPAAVVPNMTINEEYNMDALRLAGNDVDAEHDVFYYLDDRDGFLFSFKPEGVVKVEMATPIISETEARYTGFTQDGISLAEDGTYTLLLREGRNIIRMTDAAGNSAYQVLRAKPCHREISNQTRPGSLIYQPGDQVKIQYSGLFHPANKIAGIYNMSAYVTYNGTPNGSSLILGSGQYTFGSAPSAQAVTVEIPADYDAAENPVWKMDKGVIQVNGYGDPIGNHRNTSPQAGRSPNFTAVPHKTYFGTLPDIEIALNPVKYFAISVDGLPETAESHLSFNGEEILPDEKGVFKGTYGTYSIEAKADGYRCYRNSFLISDDTEGEAVTFVAAMEELGEAWNGTDKSEPSLNEDGAYEIKSGAELAWFADNVNAKGTIQDAVLCNDIHLGNFDWSPVGSSSSAPFKGKFDGRGHKVEGLYFNNPKTSNVGLFGYMNGGTITGLTVSGSVSGKQYVGGLVGMAAGQSVIDRCANHADVSGASTYVGGVAGYLNSATLVATNLYNTGRVSGTTTCGGVAGSNNKDATISNIFNVGTVNGTTVGSCIGGTTAKNNLTNAFCVAEYQITEGQTLVSPQDMESGMVAYLLGDAFFQSIGEDLYPKFEGLKVYYDADLDLYYNLATGFTIDTGEGSNDVLVTEEGIEMHQDATYQLLAKGTPEGARLPRLVWSSLDPETASVDADGLVTSLRKGSTVIRAEHPENSDLFDLCPVRVVESLGVGNIAISSESIVKVYSLGGTLISSSLKATDLTSTLSPGIYIVVSEGKAMKVRL